MINKLSELDVILIKCPNCDYERRLALHDDNSGYCICMTCRKCYLTEKVEC